MTTARTLVADRVRIPFRRPFATASGMWVERDAWIIRLFDRDGRVGLGEAVLASEPGEVADTILTALIREAAESTTTTGLPTMTELEGHGAPGRALNAALESATADLDRPGAPDLAPDGDGVGVNATLPSLGPAALAEAAQQSIESGFETLKVKAGAERETEVLVERIRAIRTAVGPDVRLRIDVNGAWDLATAEERLEAIARFDIEFVEQPLAAHDLDGLAELRHRVTVPIAADEAAESLAAVRMLLAMDAVDALVIKPARVGGPSAVAEIATLAAARGVPVVLSTLFETGVGIAAALALAASLPEVGGPALDDRPGPWPGDGGTPRTRPADRIARRPRGPDARAGHAGEWRARDHPRRACPRALPGRADRVAAMTRYPSLAVSARLAAADARPGSAIVEGSIAWTWQELDARAEAIALELLQAGVRPGSRVAMLTAPSATAVATLHAIARVGGVVAPLGPGLMPSELAVAGEVIAPDLVIHDPSLEGSARSLGGPLRSLDDLTGPSPRSDTPDALAPPPLPLPDPGAPAVIVLTSGTTGRPKAVVLSTAALVASAEAWLAVLPEVTGWLLAVGLAHVAGLGVVWRAALSGVPLVVLARPDPVAILAALGAAPHPSHVSLVPTVLTRLLDLGGGRPTAADAPGRAPRWRHDRAGPRSARDRGRLAGRPDVRPVRGRLGGDRFTDRRGGDPPGHSRAATAWRRAPHRRAGRRGHR